MVTNASLPSALSKQEIIDETAKDPVLIEALTVIKDNNNLKHSVLNQWRNQLSVTEDGLVLRDTRIIIPKALTQRIVDIGHTDKTSMEPIKVTPMPKGPWEEVDTDFFGPLPNGKYLMVSICRYSRFIIIRSLNNLKALTVTSLLDKICSEFGYMHQVRSDNGPPFKSFEFLNFCKNSGINHVRVTPLWPRANGLVKRIMQPLAKAIRVVGRPSHNYEFEVSEFTRAYNATPHSSTLIPPRDLLFRTRTSSVRLPTFLNPCSNNQLNAKAEHNDLFASETSKYHTDCHNKTKPHSFFIGQKVLLKQKQTNKTMTPFDPSPFSILKLNGSMVILTRDGKTYARNVALIQNYNAPENQFIPSKHGITRISNSREQTFPNVTKFAVPTTSIDPQNIGHCDNIPRKEIVPKSKPGYVACNGCKKEFMSRDRKSSKILLGHPKKKCKWSIIQSYMPQLSQYL